MVDDGREVGGSVELNLGQADPVCLHNTFNAYTHTHTHALPINAASPERQRKERVPAQKGLEGTKLRGNSWET